MPASKKKSVKKAKPNYMYGIKTRKLVQCSFTSKAEEKAFNSLTPRDRVAFALAHAAIVAARLSEPYTDNEKESHANT